jgi:hypothetical protein
MSNTNSGNNIIPSNSLNQQGGTQTVGGAQPQNLNHITNNIGKLVEIISQYNQKHLNQNASMLSNINNLVNTMSNMVPGESNQNKSDKKIVPNQVDSIKDTSVDKKESKVDNPDNTNNENQQNSNGEDKKGISDLILNFDSSKNNLSSYMFNVLDELKKQIYSIQYYSLVQKLFISYIFKNLDIFIEQLANNQSLNGINSSLFKGAAGFNGGFDNNMSSLSEQLTLLKKIAENLSTNQIGNPLLGGPNIEELGSLFGGNSGNLGQLSQLLSNSGIGQMNSGGISNVGNLMNMQHSNNSNNNNALSNLTNQINSMSNLNNMKNPLQAINKLFSKDANVEGNLNQNSNQNMNNLSTNNQQNNSNNNLYGSNNNMLEQLLKGMKPQQQQNQIPNSQNQGQIIMPINIETNSTNIIQNPANQMFGMGNNQHTQTQMSQSQMGNLGNSNSLLMNLNSMMGQAGGTQGFNPNFLLSNPNLMNLLLQNNPNQGSNQYPNQNNSSNFK